jgi:hypothetical protein
MVGSPAAGDGEQPGSEVAAVSVAGQALQRLQEDLRGHVLGIGHIASSASSGVAGVSAAVGRLSTVIAPWSMAIPRSRHNGPPTWHIGMWAER